MTQGSVFREGSRQKAVGSIKARDSRQGTAYREKSLIRRRVFPYPLFPRPYSLSFFCLLLSAFCLLISPSRTIGAIPLTSWLSSTLVNFYTPIKEGLVEEKALEQSVEARNLEEAQSIIKRGLAKADSDIDRINIRRLWARTLVKLQEPEKTVAEYEAIKKAYPYRTLGPGGMVLYSPAQIQWEIAKIQLEPGKGPEAAVQTAREILPSNNDDTALVMEVKLFADYLRDMENNNAPPLYQLLLQHAANVKAEVSWGDTIGREAQAALTYIKSDKTFAVKEKENLVKLLTQALQKKDIDTLEKYACQGYFYTGIYGADVQYLSSFEAVKEKIRQSFAQGPAKFTRQTFAAPGKTFIHTNGWQGLDSNTIALMIVKTKYGWEWRGWMYY